MLVLAGAAALLAYRSFDDAPAAVAAAAPARAVSGPPATSSPVAAADGRALAASAASASTLARIETAAVAPKPVEPAVPVANSAVASVPAAVENLPPQPVPAGPAKKPHGREAAARLPAKVSAPAKTNAAEGVTRRTAARKARNPEEDADTDIVAAIIARLDRRGAEPTPPAPERRSSVSAAALAERVDDCESKTDPLEARRCRNRVCAAHWGTVDACPASRAPKL